MLTQIITQPLPSTYFPSHYSLLILSFNYIYIYCNLLVAYLNKGQDRHISFKTLKQQNYLHILHTA
jgi:hypothetical protein